MLVNIGLLTPALSSLKEEREKKCAGIKGVLPEWNGARVCDPQPPGVPNGRRKFPGFSDC